MTTDKSSELKPCPFCGGEASQRTEHDSDMIRWGYIGCRCGVRTRGKFGDLCPLTWAEIRGEWNARAALPQQAQDIAEASGGAEGGPEEDRIEAAFWRFDARHKGYGQWRQAPMSERDAFKAEMRNALHAEAVRAEMRMVAKGWRKQGPQQAQETSLPDCGEAGHAEGRCGNAQCLRGGSLPPQGAERNYSDMSREALERHAKRLWQTMETAHAFWHKHALGPLAAPSCLCCGKLPDEVAIRHMELPGVVICKTCRDAALAASPAPAPQEPDKT